MTLQVWNLLVTILKIHLSLHFAASSCCLLSFPPPLSYIINSAASHYIERKKQQIKACLCSASNSILTSRWKHRQVFVPQALKRRKWLQMWGAEQSHVCPRPCIVVLLTFHLGILLVTHVRTSDRF